jgi:hypothetical protein
MFTAAMIIYVIVSILAGPFWPFDLLAGKAGLLGRILVIGWIYMLIKGS